MGKAKEPASEVIPFNGWVWVKENITFLLVAAILVVFIATVALVHQKVVQLEPFLYQKDALVLKSEVPNWIHEQGLVNHISLNPKNVQEAYFGKSFFDRNVLANVHAEMMKNKWVKSLKVSKESSGKINLYAEFPIPYVGVLCNGDWYILDEKLYVLPIKESKGLEELSLLRIVGVNLPADQLVPGKVMNFEPLKKAIVLSQEVKGLHELHLNLKEIVVIHAEGYHKYKLYFENGLEVNWGAFLYRNEVDGFPSKHLSTEQKLVGLVRKVQDRPGQLFVDVEFLE